MQITIVFHEDAIKECMEENEIPYHHLKARLIKFCNDPVVLKMLIEGTILEPFPIKH